MNQRAFLLYNNSSLGLHANFGRWVQTSELPEHHFFIADSQGQFFWKFIEEEALDWDHFPDLDLPAFNLACIEESDYLESAKRIVEELQNGPVQKVVLSRILKEPFDARQLKSVFLELAQRYPDNLTSFFFHPEMGCWLGSTPETLVRGTYPDLQTMSLAGSLKADDNESLWSSKEYEEQAYVTDFLVERISKRTATLSRTKRYTKLAGPVKHLCTDVTFELNFAETFSLIQEIHPTPAVCGVPSDLASQIYQRHEIHDRSLYTGFLGFSSKEKIDLFVNLRCMQVFKDVCGLYVGGGFTKDSDPLSEWRETEKKAQTLLAVIRNFK